MDLFPFRMHAVRSSHFFSFSSHDAFGDAPPAGFTLRAAETAPSARSPSLAPLSCPVPRREPRILSRVRVHYHLDRVDRTDASLTLCFNTSGPDGLSPNSMAIDRSSAPNELVPAPQPPLPHL